MLRLMSDALQAVWWGEHSGSFATKETLLTVFDGAL